MHLIWLIQWFLTFNILNLVLNFYEKYELIKFIAIYWNHIKTIFFRAAWDARLILKGSASTSSPLSCSLIYTWAKAAKPWTCFNIKKMQQ